MPSSKSTAAKATEAATFRFTRNEKRLLEFMARRENLTLTDLIRRMIEERAAALNVLPAIEETPVRRRPGRPRKIRDANIDQAVFEPKPTGSVPVTRSVPMTAAIATTSATGAMIAPDETVTPVLTPKPPLSQTTSSKKPVPTSPSSWTPPPPETLPVTTFGELTVAFRRHFAGRAEGTRSEFEETIVFLAENFAPDQLLAEETPLRDIDLARLTLIRDRIKVADIRFPRKNLYLTYIRMMLQFALKQDDNGLSLTPSQDLPPFTAKEIADAWPLSMKSP